MEHYISTHTFNLEETKKAYFDTNKDISSKEWFASVEGEQVKCIQHRLGDQNLWFYQWVADSEDQIHDKLATIGAGQLFITTAQEIKDYANAEEPNKKYQSTNLSTFITSS